jgi:hypothetical protein
VNLNTRRPATDGGGRQPTQRQVKISQRHRSGSKNIALGFKKKKRLFVDHM